MRAFARSSALVALGLVGACSARVHEDPHHCGSQGADCLTGTCWEGACRPALLALGSGYPAVLAIDQSRVYWATWTGAISAVPKEGGATVHITTDISALLGQLATDGQSLFVAGLHSGAHTGLARVSMDGVVTAVGDATDGTGVALDPLGGVWWGAWGSGLWHSDADGSNAHVVVAANVGALAADDQGVHWLEGVPWPWFGWGSPCADPPTKLRSLDTGGTTPRERASVHSYGIATDGESVYWRDFCSGDVMRLAHDATVPVKLASGLSTPREGEVPFDTVIAADALGAYVVADTGVVRVPRNGGATTFVAEVRAVTQLAVDDQRVYILARVPGTSSSASAVLAVAKPR